VFAWCAFALTCSLAVLGDYLCALLLNGACAVLQGVHLDRDLVKKLLVGIVTNALALAW
jgi:hypothetical protein